jgi:cobalt-zinc-cadmium efflux system membrane fusion protein
MKHAHRFILGWLFMAACHHAAANGEVSPPAGEVWLTDQQIKDAKIDVAPLVEQPVDDTILTSGRVTLDDLRAGHVFSPVTGRVLSVNAGLGAQVKRGDPLAVIESPDVGTATSDARKAEADLIAAEHDLKRKKELFEEKAASAADVEIAEDNYRKANAELQRARNKASLLRLGNVNTGSQTFTLTAPIDGEVLARSINVGVEVLGQYNQGANVELFTIGALDKVWVIADVYEMDLPRVKVGSPVHVTVVSYPKKVFDGQVDWIGGMLDPTTRTARVRCTFDNADRLLRPEMFATVSVSVDVKKALALPHDAIVRMGEQTVVFVETGKTKDNRTKFIRKPVTVDEGEGSKWVPIEHGLAEGERVVVGGGILLSGML